MRGSEEKLEHSKAETATMIRQSRDVSKPWRWSAGLDVLKGLALGQGYEPSQMSDHLDAKVELRRNRRPRMKLILDLWKFTE